MACEELERLVAEARALMEEEIASGSPRAGFLVGAERLGNVIVARGIREPYAVVGDIHGDAVTLGEILAQVGGAPLVFLGDYVDRGPPEGQVRALETVLGLVLEGRAVALRGNHEPPRELIPHPHDLPEALASACGRLDGARLYEKLLDLFNIMPHALVVEGSFIAVHGGLPTSGLEKDIVEYLGGGPGEPPFNVLIEVLWNDPTEDVPVRRASPRGVGFLWGPKVTEAALEKARAKLVVRGHEFTPRGYKWNHGGRVLTLFSRKGDPYGNKVAAYLFVEPGCGLEPGSEKCLRLVGEA